VVFIDEAGIDVNNRKYMDMAISQIEYLKKHRHYRCEMWFFSQSHEDIDVTVRRLAQNYYVVSRTLLNRFTHGFYFKRAVKKIGIDKETRQFMDYYDWVLFSKYKFNGKKYWGMFDSFDTSDLPDFPQSSSSPGKSLLNRSAPVNVDADTGEVVSDPPLTYTKISWLDKFRRKRK
jgi:hypothetical protein